MLLAFSALHLHPGAGETLRFKGDYFLYSDDLDYIYGGGNIIMKAGGRQIKGDVVYIDVRQLCGVIYGGVLVTKTVENQEEEKKWDAVFFKGIPPQWLTVSYGDEIVTEGDNKLETSFMNFVKKKPGALKGSALYFEFREFRIDKNRKIKAKTVIPYMMGLPTVPLKRFTIKRGEWAEKTMLSFNNVNYSALDGLSVAFFLRMREKFIKGDYDLKLYERGLFKMNNPKRGALFSGKSSFLVKKKEFLGISTLLNSGNKSFNLRLTHSKDAKYFRYSLSQDISGRDRQPVFFEFRSNLAVKGLKYIIPEAQFTHNLKKSYSYRFSTPLKLWKKLFMNVSWQRKILRDNYRSDTSDFSTSLNLNLPFVSLSSNYNFSKNLLEASVRKNFSVNMRLKPVLFLGKNIAIDISSFYMFSSLPYGEGQTMSRISPGVNFALRSAGAAMPLGFKLVPSFTFNHLWDNREENFTDFNYSLSLQKIIGNFRGSLEYALASRYRADNFWIEGSSRQNMNINFEFKNSADYSFLLRFYFNHQLALENTSFTGRLNLPFDLSFSSFLLYYNREDKFQTLEVFIEKSFKKKIKIQGGYSLALKRFFIKFLTN